MRDWYCIQGQPKVFCIGKAKTGTTLLEKTFKGLLGYLVGDQRAAEMLLRHYIRRDFQTNYQILPNSPGFPGQPIWIVRNIQASG